VDDACTFCRIVAGTEPASIVYEDRLTLAFMDISQLADGHVLVVPREHYPDQIAVPDDVAAALGVTTKRVARAVDSAFRPAGLTLWQSIRAAGGQDVFHLHWHVIPRLQADGLLRIYPARPGHPDGARLDELAAAIRDQFGE
jgi:histidine triad (HIT) family protein